MLQVSMTTRPWLRGVAIALLSGAGFFLFLGALSAVIPNPLFVRMTPVGWLEWFSLVSTSLLLGSFFGLRDVVSRNGAGGCGLRAGAGGVLGFLAFGCSVCNKLLVLALGATGVLTYFEPVRPLFALISVPLLLYANLGLLQRLQVAGPGSENLSG